VVSTNTQRPDVSNITQFYIRYSYKVQTALRIQLECVGVYTTNTQTSTRGAKRGATLNITPRPIAPAARRGGALRPPGERLLCMIVLRCDRADAKT
jgi:hypothetical protein